MSGLRQSEASDVDGSFLLYISKKCTRLIVLYSCLFGFVGGVDGAIIDN
jgi:hypothetical protein